MAIFTNQATLTYNGTSTNSNVAYGEILEILAAAKTSVEESYTQGSCYPNQPAVPVPKSGIGTAIFLVYHTMVEFRYDYPYHRKS